MDVEQRMIAQTTTHVEIKSASTLVPKILRVHHLLLVESTGIGQFALALMATAALLKPNVDHVSLEML